MRDHPRGLPASARAIQRKRRMAPPLSDFGPLQRLPRALPRIGSPRRAAVHPGVLPWGSLPLQRTNAVNRRSCSDPTRSAIPLRPFADPWGFDPHRASRPCFVPLTLLGFSALQGLLSRTTLPGSSPGETLTALRLSPVGSSRVHEGPELQLSEARQRDQVGRLRRRSELHPQDAATAWRRLLLRAEAAPTGDAATTRPFRPARPRRVERSEPCAPPARRRALHVHPSSAGPKHLRGTRSSLAFARHGHAERRARHAAEVGVVLLPERRIRIRPTRRHRSGRASASFATRRRRGGLPPRRESNRAPCNRPSRPANRTEGRRGPFASGIRDKHRAHRLLPFIRTDRLSHPRPALRRSGEPERTCRSRLELAQRRRSWTFQPIADPRFAIAPRTSTSSAKEQVEGPRGTKAAPPGHSVLREPRTEAPECCIRCSICSPPELPPPPRRSGFPAWAAPPAIRSRPWLRIPSSSSPKLALSVFPPGARHLPLSRSPAVLVFSGLPRFAAQGGSSRGRPRR
jgi:hypothetical protein